MEPKEALDIALGQAPGKGILLAFSKREDMERFRWRCYAAMGVETRRSMRELDRSSPSWGKHPWQGVVLRKRPPFQLWLGSTLDTGVVLVEGVPEREEEGGDG